MTGGRCTHRGAGKPWALALILVVASSSIATRARAFEAFDGRLQAHGFYTSQLRALNADYSEQWDVAQWYQVFNLEIELDLVQDTVGPIDLLSAYVRAEVRYDCIYSRGCGMFRSMNAYGDRSKSLPRRLNSEERIRHSGRIRISNDPDLPIRYSGSNTDPLTPENQPALALFANGTGADGFDPRETCDLGLVCTYIAGGGGATTTSPSPIGGPPVAGTSLSTVWPDNDDPFPAIGRDGGYDGFRFADPGGPWLPKNEFKSNATSSGFGNPFDDRAGSYALQASVYNGYLFAVDEDTPLFTPLEDMNGNGVLDPGEDLNMNGMLDAQTIIDPDRLNLVVNAATNGEDLNGNGVLDPGEDINGNTLLDAGGLAAVGGGANPYRPAPVFREDGAGIGQARNSGDPRGMFLPSLHLARALDSGDLEAFEKDYNFNEAKRAWNRGSSQRDEKELKEAYLEIELFDNQLYMRIGKQQIVWGKTELFRTTDQFNPTDAALASLPSLEESRIALWSAKGIWSFYEVGPLEDVRLELALNFDDYEQIDIGACGEPYAPNLTCLLTFGGFAHGVFGFGIAGVEKPPSPWQSLRGWEVGARLEWRYDRFSFALMDFWGYDDLPTVEILSTFTRNVDPISGRPREIFDRTLNVERRPSVDPYTGSPVANIAQIGRQGICMTGFESACLNPSMDLDGDGLKDGIAPDGTGILANNRYEDRNANGVLDPGEDLDGDGILDFGSEREGLTHSAVAQQIYAYTCATTVGFSALDRSACSLNILGSRKLLDPSSAIPISIGQALGALLAGSPQVAELASTGQTLPGSAPMPISAGNGSAGGFVFPFVRLEVDPGDLDFDAMGVGPGNPNTNGQTTPCMDTTFTGAPFPCGGQGAGIVPNLFTLNPGGPVQVASTIGGVLSPQQEALLGCGPFWGTQCDDSGIDLLTAEGSALFQSWPGVEGTVRGGDITALWHTNQRVTIAGGAEAFAAQPGTRDWYFDRTRSHAIGPICTTANFGGELFDDDRADSLNNDDANGNQAILPGCRRKWKRSPEDQGFGRDNPNNQLLALNLYGQDLACARERLANANSAGGSAVSANCLALGWQGDGSAFNAATELDSQVRVDPRSWELRKDGDPDSLGLRHVELSTPIAPIGNFCGVGLPATFACNIFLPPPRIVDVSGTPTSTRVPDFFYGAGFQVVRGASVFGTQSENPAAGAAFDACNFAGYPSGVLQEYGGPEFVPCGRGGHPMTGQPFASEMAAVSWNLMVLLIQQELQPILEERRDDCAIDPSGQNCSLNDYEFARAIFLDPDQCSFVNPALCDVFRTLQGAIGLQRNVRRAGGNGVHGRRTFAWQSGGEAILTYQKRNVLGFSMDFAEDVSKANFSLEFTWIEGIKVANNNAYDGLSEANDFNLTISADRPTFINFLNSNRTFFFNWQFFMSYREGWKKGFTNEGPWSFLTTFAVATGYFQDRLTPSAVAVYDIRTQSGAFLPSIGYRFTQNFSAAVGMAFFFGKPDFTDEPLTNIAPADNRSAMNAGHLYDSPREGGLAIVRDRDEVWAQIRYTF